MSETVAAKHLRSFLDRIERLEEERKSIADDIADVYKELVGEGFDKDAAKVVLKIRKAKDGIDGYTAKSGVVDAYLAALGMLPEATRAPAPARTREGDISYAELRKEDNGVLAAEKKHAPVDWDEISRREFPQNSSVQVYFIEAPSLGLIKIGSTGMVERRVAAIQRGVPVPTSLIGVIPGGSKREHELHQQYADQRIHGEWFSAEIRQEILLLCNSAAPQEFPPHDLETGELADQVPATTKGDDYAKSVHDRHLTEPRRRQTSQVTADDAATGDAGAPVAAASPSSSEPFQPVPFLRKTLRDYRTHCQQPDQCAASGLNHCHACQKLADAGVAA